MEIIINVKPLTKEKKSIIEKLNHLINNLEKEVGGLGLKLISFEESDMIYEDNEIPKKDRCYAPYEKFKDENNEVIKLWAESLTKEHVVFQHIDQSCRRKYFDVSYNDLSLRFLKKLSLYIPTL